MANAIVLRRLLSGLWACAACLLVRADGAAYEIGAEMDGEAFWKSDPVLFVKRHEAQGFRFTSSSRDGADTRLDGAVTYHGLPVYESKVAFTADNSGIARVELLLFTTAGTESVKVVELEDGRRMRTRTRSDKAISRDDFLALTKDVRAALTPDGAKAPKVEAANVKPPTVQKFQTWPKSAISTQATLTWSYEQEGRKADTFKPGFVRLAVDGPARLAILGGKVPGAVAKGAKKIADNVIRDPRGDVYIDGVPMVDQGQKGYCAAAVSERVLRYYGVDVDEHEIAQAAGTTAEGGTSTRGMKDAVASVGRRYKLGTVVCYGDFEKSVSERIAGLEKEVADYNKAAKKLRKPAIPDSAYVHRAGGTILYDPVGADRAKDAEVVKDMKVNGPQKSKYTKFMKDVRQQVDKGIPLLWGVVLGTYPEPECPQANGGHMRLIVGYNDKKKEILYSDSWGAGHELKRMPADWAWTISRCLLYMKPLR